MTPDDIIRLAQEAGGRIEHIGTNIAWFEFLPKNLERFAALVAAAERERSTFELAESYRCGWDGGVQAEREECAKVCDREAEKLGQSHEALIAGICAASIRERDKK